MKRKVFEIRVNGDLLETRSAWNAAIRATENHARAVARAENAYYVLGASESTKGEYGFTSGARRWVGNNGKTLDFTIKQLVGKE